LTGPYDSILFDFDGVLADTEPIHWACWAETLAPLDIELSWETYRANCIGVADRNMLVFLASLAASAVDPESLRPQYAVKKARHKPYPEPYLLAAARLKARRPLVVEDSDAGVASARAAGFDVIQVISPVQVAELTRVKISRAASILKED
jgi:HAD superfamily hydrolase (TIGR01509 family)